MEIEDAFQPGTKNNPWAKVNQPWQGYKSVAAEDWNTSSSEKSKNNVTDKKKQPLEETKDRPPWREAPFQIEQFLAPAALPVTKPQTQLQTQPQTQPAVVLPEEDDETLSEPAAVLLDALDPDKEARVNNSDMDPLELWFPTELKLDEICRRRQHIKNRILSEFQNNFTLTLPTLRQLICEYDRLFFENRLFEALNHQKTALNVKLGGVRMKKGTAACCAYAGDVCTIHLHPGLADLKISEVGDVNGVECKDLLDCVQLVLEHEMVHMLICVFLRLKESHGRNFKALASGLFGHPLYTHALGSKESAEQRVLRAQDAEAKRKLYTPGSVIQIDSGKAGGAMAVGAVIVRKQETVTVMFADGRILEKVPYLLTDIWVPPDEFDQHDSLQVLEKHYMLFLDNKKNLTEEQQVEYTDSQGKIKIGTVLKKKPLGVLLQISPVTTSLLPYHTIRAIQT